jgi:small subunit ribosomal protein S5
MLNKNEDNLVSFIAQVRRNDKVVKGGKNCSYSVLVICGDQKGRWAVGFGKHKEVLLSKQKAIRSAKNNLMRVNLKESRTIHHDVEASHGATNVYLRSAEKGTGIVAGGAMRLIFEALGVKDIVAKCVGSSCPHNLVHATMKALKLLRTPKTIAIMRRKNVDEIIRNSKMLTKLVKESN